MLFILSLQHGYVGIFPKTGSGLITDVDVLDSSPHPVAFSKACLKNVFTVILVLIYLMLTTVAVFLAYQTISDFLEKLNHPVMSVSYKEVEEFAPPGGVHTHSTDFVIHYLGSLIKILEFSSTLICVCVICVIALFFSHCRNCVVPRESSVNKMSAPLP